MEPPKKIVLPNDVLFLIARLSPELYRKLQLASRQFWLYIRRLSPSRKEEIRQSFRRLHVDHKSGCLRIWQTLPNRKIDGTEERFYPHDKKEYEATWRDGCRNGWETWWYYNGNKWFEIPFCMGKKCGQEKCWFPNGEKKYLITYRNDVKEGLQEEWDENGQWLYAIVWSNGHIIKRSFEEDDAGYFEPPTSKSGVRGTSGSNAVSWSPL